MKEADFVFSDDNIRNVINCFKVSDGSNATNIFARGFFSGITNVCAGNGTIKGDAREAFIINVGNSYHSQLTHLLNVTIRRDNNNINSYVAKGDVIINTKITDANSVYKWICTSEIGQTKTWKEIS